MNNREIHPRETSASLETENYRELYGNWQISVSVNVKLFDRVN